MQRGLLTSEALGGKGESSDALEKGETACARESKSAENR